MTDSIESMFSAPDDEVRREAALFLKNNTDSIGQERAIGMLVAALLDTSWRVRKTAVEILIEAFPLDAYFDSLVSLLYNEENAGARNSAIEALVKGGPRCAEKLMVAYGTADADVRKFIIDIAGEIAHKDLIPLLTKALMDSDENVKAAAVEHLGSLKDVVAVDMLIGILGERDMWTAYPAIEALGMIGDLRALPSIVDALQDRILREPALKALGNIGGEEVVKFIVPYLTDRSRAVRQTAFVAIGKVNYSGVSSEVIKTEIEERHGSEAVNAFLDAAASSNHEMRVSALMLLAMLGDSRAIKPMLDLAADFDDEGQILTSLAHIADGIPDVFLRNIDEFADDSYRLRYLVAAMSMSARPEFREKLVEFLVHDDGHVRASAASGLGRIGDPASITPLLEAVHDRYEDVEDVIVDALISLKGGLDPRVVESLMRDVDPGIRKLAIPILMDIGTKDSRDAIAFLLKDPSYIVRKAAIECLADNIDSESEGLLIHSLTDENLEVRSAVAMRLGETRDEKFLEPLILMLSDTEDNVRVSACKALGLQGKALALRHLNAALSDSNGFVVASALEAIARIGDPDGIEMIIAMLDSQDREIRRTAIRSLAGFEAVYKYILPYLMSDDWATRYEAARALRHHLREPGVMEKVQGAHDKEDDHVVREALKELLDV